MYALKKGTSSHNNENDRMTKWSKCSLLNMSLELKWEIGKVF